MIQIAVISRQGMPTGQRLAAQFGPEGGTIGRADTNTLVLSDPDRTVSRVHGQILFRDGRYFIVDRGSNPMQCNGRPLGAGNEAQLNDGDRLVVGGFELGVQSLATPSVAAPSASAMPAPLPATGDAARGTAGDDPFGDLLAGLAPPPAPVAARRAPAGAEAGGAGAADPMLFPDPMADTRVRAPGAVAADPFADLLGAAPAAPAVGGMGAFDDFSDLGLAAASGSKGVGIDALFGGPDAGRGLGCDPLALSPLADPLLQPNTASDLDPLAALQQGSARPSAAPRSDHLPIGQFGFVPPVAGGPPLDTPSGSTLPPVRGSGTDRGARSEPPPSPMASASAQPSAAAPPLVPDGHERSVDDDEPDEVLFDDQTGLPIARSAVPSAPAAPSAAPMPGASPPLPGHLPPAYSGSPTAPLPFAAAAAAGD
ncbi:MAG: FHA domain-containing protein, partial [Comamonadaceae bacterium]